MGVAAQSHSDTYGRRYVAIEDEATIWNDSVSRTRLARTHAAFFERSGEIADSTSALAALQLRTSAPVRAVRVLLQHQHYRPPLILRLLPLVHNDMPGNELAEKVLAGPRRIRSQAEEWIAKQPPAIEVAVATLLGSGQGAFLGTVMGTMTKLDPNAGKMFNPPAGANPDVAQRMQAIQAGGPMAQARNFAVMTGVNAGLSLAIKRYRNGVEDARGVMIAGFGSGAAFSLVSGMTTGNPLQTAFSTGVLFALLQGGFYQVGKRFQQPSAGGPKQYERAGDMLDRLGLSNYQKNLKKALLTDNTIMLWNENALQEARIPPGPRLLILHHLEQYKHILKPGMPPPNQLPLPPQAAQSQEA